VDAAEFAEENFFHNFSGDGIDGNLHLLRRLVTGEGNTNRAEVVNGLG
jgi:hypothetical protein